MIFRILLLTIWMALAALPHPVDGQERKPEPLVPREQHPWGKFPPGAWKRMRITKEAFDERGVPTSTVYHVKTTVKSVGASSYTLLTEQTADVAGQSYSRLSQELTQGFSGESQEQSLVSVDRVGESELTVSGRRIPCQVRKAVMNGQGDQRSTTTAYYSPEVTPHLLRREQTVASGAEGKPATTVEEVVAVGMPYEFLGRRRTVAFVRTVQKLPKQSLEAMEVWCDEVPGGVIAQWSKELDQEGKLIGRTTLELVDFESGKATAGFPAPRPRLFDRNRPRRGDEKMGAPQRRDR